MQARGEVMMRAFPKWAAFGALAAVVSLSACASNPEGEVASAAQVGIDQGPPEVAHMGFLRDALGKIALRSDQKGIVEQLLREADARHEPIPKARLALRA